MYLQRYFKEIIKIEEKKLNTLALYKIYIGIFYVGTCSSKYVTKLQV